MDLQKLAPKPGQTFTVTITRTPTRESARKTLERLFMSDGEFRAPIDARAARHTWLARTADRAANINIREHKGTSPLARANRAKHNAAPSPVDHSSHNVTAAMPMAAASTK